jgi:hypothetical protein
VDLDHEEAAYVRVCVWEDVIHAVPSTCTSSKLKIEVKDTHLRLASERSPCAIERRIKRLKSRVYQLPLITSVCRLEQAVLSHGKICCVWRKRLGAPFFLCYSLCRCVKSVRDTHETSMERLTLLFHF